MIQPSSTRSFTSQATRSPQGPAQSPAPAETPDEGAAPAEQPTDAPSMGTYPATRPTDVPSTGDYVATLPEEGAASGVPFTTTSTSGHDVTFTVQCCPREHTVHALTGVHLAVEGAQMANVLAGAMVRGTIGNALVGVGMTTLGGYQIANGIRERSTLEVVEGAGTALMGFRSGIEAVATGSEILGFHKMAELAHGATPWMEPLGIAHGTIEAGVGAYTFYQGYTRGDRDTMVSGAMGIGLGASVVAASAGGGLPAILAATAFLAGKTIYHQHEDIAYLLNLGPQPTR